MNRQREAGEDSATGNQAPVREGRSVRLLARGWSRGALLTVVTAALGIGLVAAGAYWHQPLTKRFGMVSGPSPQQSSATTLTEGKSPQLWTCGMHPQVIQDHPGDCPICHMKLTPLARDNDADSTARAGKIAYWWDPMIGASSISDKPGKSAMGMDLVPVREDAISGGTGVKIDPVVVQNMGVRVATVERGKLRQTIRAVGFVAEAQPLIHDVNLRVSGWIDKLYAATEGQHVEQGAPLFDLYSPDVQIAVQELIAARRSAAHSSTRADAIGNESGQALVQASRGKLSQWGLNEDEINRLAKLEQAPRTVTFYSPVSGHLTIKNVVEGAAVKAGDRILELVDHSTLWLDAQVYEQDLPLIKLGQEVSASVEAMPGRRLEGKIIFIHPHVDPATRTTLARVELPNPNMQLRPGMYATIEITSQLSDDALLVPREAIIDTGTRAIAFLAVGDGRFEPRNVVVGLAGEGGRVQIVSGLAPGDVVVTSGQFLLDAESRLREAIQRHLDEQLLTKPGGTATSAGADMMQAPSTGTSTNIRDSTTAMPDYPPVSAAVERSIHAASHPTTEGLAGQLLWSADVDQVYVAYLKIAHDLVGPEAQVVDVKPLVTLASRVTDATVGGQATLPRRIRDAAAAMEGKALAEQRKGFKALSDAILTMVQVCPPSVSLGPSLFVAHCPMAFGTGADWLQKSQVIANPYLPSMVDCGEVTQTVQAVPKR